MDVGSLSGDFGCGAIAVGTVDVGALSGDAEWGQQCGDIEWGCWVWGQWMWGHWCGVIEWGHRMGTLGGCH